MYLIEGVYCTGRFPSSIKDDHYRTFRQIVILLRNLIGQVYLGDEWINRAVVAQGWARPFLPYLRSDLLEEVGRAARGDALGMWAQHRRSVVDTGRQRDIGVK